MSSASLFPLEAGAWGNGDVVSLAVAADSQVCHAREEQGRETGLLLGVGTEEDLGSGTCRWGICMHIYMYRACWCKRLSALHASACIRGRTAPRKLLGLRELLLLYVLRISGQLAQEHARSATPAAGRAAKR